MSSHFLAKKLSSFSLSSLRHHHLALLTPLLRLSFSTQPSEHKEIPFLPKYLISTFGFSPDRALKVSTEWYAISIKSEEGPASVVQFLKDTGLSDSQIKSVVSFHPPLLASSVEKTLKPKMHELINGGFSGELLVQFIRNNPAALARKETLSRLLFWRDFAGNNDEVLLKMIKRNGLLITYDIYTYVVPRIKLFNEYGLSNQDIAGILARGFSCCMSRSLDGFKQVLDFIEEAGIPRGSGMFIPCFKTLCGYSKETIEKKMAFLNMMYGWSQEDVYFALRKSPTILAISLEKVKSNMDFLIREAKMEPKSIVSRPYILGYSQQKRLVPRHHVLSVLATKGLKTNISFCSVCVVSEKLFFKRYIEPYEKDVPGLAEAYFAALDGNISV